VRKAVTAYVGGERREKSDLLKRAPSKGKSLEPNSHGKGGVWSWGATKRKDGAIEISGEPPKNVGNQVWCTSEGERQNTGFHAPKGNGFATQVPWQRGKGKVPALRGAQGYGSGCIGRGGIYPKLDKRQKGKRYWKCGVPKGVPDLKKGARGSGKVKEHEMGLDRLFVRVESSQKKKPTEG